MENPIKYSDLFQGVEQGISEQIRALQSLRGEYESLLNAVKSQAKSASESLASVGSDKGGTKAKAVEVEKLYEAYNNLNLAIRIYDGELEKLYKTEAQRAKIVKLGEEADNARVGSMKQLQAQLKLAEELLASLSEKERQSSTRAAELTKYIQELNSQILAYGKTLKATANIEEQSAKATNTIVSNSQKLASSYSSLSALVSKTGIDLNSLLATEKQMQTATKQGELANNSLSGSYNQLAAQYNLIKLALNAMGEEMRESAEVGKVWEAEAKRIYDTMKMMQSATGKMTLNVGNYEESFTKAFNGLNIATQQVLREMPTLANSVQQFFIAISNNVPILVDQIKAVKEETGSTKAVLAGLVKSVFSWQTALLVLLTILPRVAKAIRDKKKAQEEDNKTTKETISYTKMMANAHNEIAKSEVNAIAKIKILYQISQDYTRSLEDRIRAAQALKEEYEDALANYSAEEIAAGKATESIDKLTESVLKQAKAEAIRDKITEKMKEYLDTQEAVTDAEKRRDQALKDFTASGESRKYLKAWQDADADVTKYDSHLQDLQATMKNLVKEMPTDGLVDQLLGGRGGKSKDKAIKDLDYLRQWEDSLLGLIRSDERRETAETKYEYDRRIEDLKAYLAEQQSLKAEDREITKEGELYIRGLISALESESYRKQSEIHRKYLEERQKELEEWNKKGLKEQQKSDDDVIKELEEAQKAQIKALEIEADIQSAYAVAQWKNKKNERKALIDIEIEYWNQYRNVLVQNGTLTIQEAAKIQANIEALLAEKADIAPKNLFDWLGMTFDEEIPKQAQTIIKNMFDSAYDYMKDILDARIELADQMIEQAKREADAAKGYLDIELQARANGYASNVSLARDRYKQELALQKQAQEQKAKLQRQQMALNSAEQASSMTLATANLIASFSKMSGVGLALSVAAIAAMWTTFLASKAKAAQLAKVTYGEGGVEMLQGGSHASGHDIPLGMTSDGKERRAEGGEFLAIINKKNSRKYGSMIPDIINSLNDGTFAEKYRNASMDMAQFALNFGDSTDLSRLERGVENIVEQGGVRTIMTADGRIEIKGKTKRIIHTK